MEQVVDLLVIGAGAAGMSAVFAKLNGLDVLLCEKSQPSRRHLQLQEVRFGHQGQYKARKQVYLIILKMHEPF
jgi:thioredoxin reductase